MAPEALTLPKPPSTPISPAEAQSGRTLEGFRVYRVYGFIVEARKLEHDYPRALKVKYKGS